jgi:hypothetical protein
MRRLLFSLCLPVGEAVATIATNQLRLKATESESQVPMIDIDRPMQQEADHLGEDFAGHRNCFKIKAFRWAAGSGRDPWS